VFSDWAVLLAWYSEETIRILGALDHQEKQWNTSATIQMLQPFVLWVSE